MIHIQGGSISFSHEGGSIFNGDSGIIRQITQTKEQLVAWNQHVDFIGEPVDSFIDTNSVQIAAGATIDLRSGITITGNTKIGSSAVISGGTINFSIINGEVSGGNVNHSSVFASSTVSGGYVNYSTIKELDSVSGGSVNHSTIRDGGVVTGGYVNHCIVENGTIVSSGNHNLETVNGRPQPVNQDHLATIIIGNNIRISNQARIQSSGSWMEVGGGASIQPFTSRSQAERANMDAKSTLPPAMEVDREEIFTCEPPKSLADNVISFDLIHEAVCTPNGDSYDRPIIEQWIKDHHTCPVTRRQLKLADLIPNRNLQETINIWKEEHRM